MLRLISTFAFALAALLPARAFAVAFAPFDITNTTTRHVIWDLDFDNGGGSAFISPNAVNVNNIGTSGHTVAEQAAQFTTFGKLQKSFDPQPGADPNDDVFAGLGSQVPFGLTCDPTVAGCLTTGAPVGNAGADGLLGTTDDVDLTSIAGPFGNTGANLALLPDGRINPVGSNPFRKPGFGPFSVLNATTAVGTGQVAQLIYQQTAAHQIPNAANTEVLTELVDNQPTSFRAVNFSSNGTTATITQRALQIRDSLRAAAFVALFGPDQDPNINPNGPLDALGNHTNGVLFVPGNDNDPNAALLLPVDNPNSANTQWTDSTLTIDVASGAASLKVFGTVFSSALGQFLPFNFGTGGLRSNNPLPSGSPAIGTFAGIPGAAAGTQEDVNIANAPVDFFCTTDGTSGHLGVNGTATGNTVLAPASLGPSPCIQETTVPYDAATGVLFLKGPIFAGTLVAANDSGTIGLREVPEPGTLLLLGAGLAGLAALRRRKA